MLPTPSTSHLSFDNIYEPAEDSFLLLDTLSSPPEVAFLHTRFQPDNLHPENSPSPIFAELGTGSGVVLAFLIANAQIIAGRRDVFALGIDVNPFACKGALQTVTSAKSAINTSEIAELKGPGIPLGILNADLAAPIRVGEIDLVVFNPPYVPTDELPSIYSGPECNHHESAGAIGANWARDSHLLSLSYAGGKDGMEVTDRFLAQLPQILSPRGVAYLLLCMGNHPADVIQRVKDMQDVWKAEIVGSSGKTAGWEKLVVVRIWKAQG